MLLPLLLNLAQQEVNYLPSAGFLAYVRRRKEEELAELQAKQVTQRLPKVHKALPDAMRDVREALALQQRINELVTELAQEYEQDDEDAILLLF